jgi:hypothetical protein
VTLSPSYTEADSSAPVRTLIIDVEMKPALVWAWDLKVYGYISPDMIHTPKSLLCFAWKWLGEDQTHFASEWDHGRDGMAGILWDLLDEAHIVVGHNSARFDVPIILTELMLAGFDPPSPFQQVDTLKAARKFAFMSNKLGEVAKMLGTIRKLENEGFSLWLKVMNGDRIARAMMEEYNRGDILATEAVFLKLRPWIITPDVALIDASGSLRCPSCGSSEVRSRGSYFTRTGEYKRYRCECGRWSRSVSRVATTSLRSAA